ncbi:phosducin-like protein [Lineus longissimus]|uniref:phosducin-like protein n=1 Tax=Lineus longissimus TaxID=88925 RepID=UPI002B4ED785
MALSLDDKLLGEKTHYYCSSDEGEDDDDKESCGSDEEGGQAASHAAADLPPPEVKPYDGTCTNTGPKGVINDWRRFKQLENEKRDGAEEEKLELMKKLSITCRSHLDDQKEAQKDDEFMAMINEMEDEFLEQYRAKRMEEMRRAYENQPMFGKVLQLRKEQFLDAIDKEKPQVTVIIYLYEDGIPACKAMSGCLACLAMEYPRVKFCRIKASEAKLSYKFSAMGVPALLVYKSGELIGNFVRISNELGDDFFANEVEGYLLEHGLLPDKTLQPNMPFKPKQDDDSGSEFEVE